MVPNRPNTERSPALSGGGGVLGALDALAERRHDETPRSKWPIEPPGEKPVRCTPSLQAPQGPLVDFLTNGFGYDDQSVSSAVKLGNEHFARRDLPRAIDFYGAAYEIGRLHFDYKPLMHDLVLRRVQCYSMMGDLKQAMHEVGLALKVIPNSAVALLYEGLLNSKLGEADEANLSFQNAVAQSRELRNLIDCLVALFMLAQGHCDRAIQVCSQVLARDARFGFALLVRGDAYKFHASGYFSRHAADDYTALLEIDLAYQPLIGDLMTPHQHARFDELVLSFHPRLRHEGPRPYEEYPMCREYRKRQPFVVAALVVLATAKLKACVRSTQLVHNVEKRNAELLKARAAAERKVRVLVEAQQKLSAVETNSCTQVWDSDSRRYRRYWMERPIGFPRRGGAAPCDARPAEEARKADEAPPPCPVSPPAELPATLLPSALGAATASASPPASPRLQREPSWQPGLANSARPVEGTHKMPSADPTMEMRLPSSDAPVLFFSQPTTTAEDVRHPGPPQPPPPPPVAHPEDSAFDAPAADLLLDTPAAATPAHPAATKRSQEDRYAEQPRPERLGHNWTESQWLAKALELADTFAILGPGGLGPAPTSPETERRAPRTVRPPIPPCATSMAAAKGGDANVVDVVVEHGLSMVPDWFKPLDRIYHVDDMGFFHTEPEPLAAASGLAGAPGFSYIVPKPPAREPQQIFSAARGRHCGAEEGDLSGVANEAFMRRYHHKILQTAVPGLMGSAAGRA